MSEYDQIWSRFAAERRLELGGHMDPAWQDDHTLSASLVIPVDASNFAERLEPLREALRPFSFVSLHPDYFMHITLVFAGFPVRNPQRDAEISRDRLAEIEARARLELSGFPAFRIRLANLNAFPGAAFIEAHDGDMLYRLRRALCRGCGLEEPSGPLHMTLAYFQTPDGMPAPPELVSAIERYRDWPVGEVVVDRVEMSLLDLRSEYPEPRILARITLE